MRTVKQKKRFANVVLSRLKKAYLVTGPFTEWRNIFELVIVTVLSAQCTDERVNQISPELFRRYPTACSMAEAELVDIECIIFSTGFYRSKARYLKGIGELLCEKYNGEVPNDFNALLQFPGVSKKSACVILAKGFGNFVGVAVDTHVLRVAPRLGLVQTKSRDFMAMKLEDLYPKKEYLNVNEYLITLGRTVCTPRSPKCSLCVLKDICPSSQGFLSKEYKIPPPVI